MIRRLCIIGVGLIGGSLALALRRAGYCKEIVAGGRNADRLRKAVELGVVDRYETDLAAAVKDADMIFVAVPLGAMAAVFEAIDGHLAEDAVITDGGSAKQCVVDDARRAFGDEPPFVVPGHPIAGTERSGVEAAFAELYDGRRVILTPTDSTSPRALQRVADMWHAAGAKVETMGVEHHDKVLAGTSHLPHVLAYSLVGCLTRLDDAEEIFRYAAGGFRDFTRIAQSDPVMWRDICLANRDALLEMMGRYRQELESLTSALEQNDGQALLEEFSRSKAARDRFRF